MYISCIVLLNITISSQKKFLYLSYPVSKLVISILFHSEFILFSFLRRASLTFNNNKHECFTSRRPSHSQFSKELVHSYVWLESEFREGSNQIASAFYHKLTTIDLTTIRTMNPTADGFVGKNKSFVLMGMFSKFLTNGAPPPQQLK